MQIHQFEKKILNKGKMQDIKNTEIEDTMNK